MKRRNFLKQSGAAGFATVLGVPALSASDLSRQKDFILEKEHKVPNHRTGNPVFIRYHTTCLKLWRIMNMVFQL